MTDAIYSGLQVLALGLAAFAVGFCLSNLLWVLGNRRDRG